MKETMLVKPEGENILFCYENIAYETRGVIGIYQRGYC